MISFPAAAPEPEPEPEAEPQPAARRKGDFDYSRWDSVGADIEDDDDPMANLTPEERSNMEAKMKNMQGMLDAMSGKGRDPEEVKAARKAAKELRKRAPPPRTLLQCVPPTLRPELRQLAPDGGCLLRTVKAPPSPGEKARARAKCNFDWRAEYFSDTGQRRPIDPEKDEWRECPGGGIRLGKSFKVQGWELAVATMQVGETAEVFCAPRYAEGFSELQMVLLRQEHAAGCPGGPSAIMGCPACNPELTQKQLEFQNSGRLARKGEPIVFTIRLTSIEQFDVTVAEFWELDVESKLEAAEKWRLEGNSLFAKGSYREAGDLYHKAVSYLETMLDTCTSAMTDESEENTALAARLVALKTPLHLNRALAFLKLDEFVEAGKSCEKVLAEEPDNVKAVFRLGQVFNGLHEYEKAERHWKHAAKLARAAGNNAVVKSSEKQIEAMKRVRAKAKAKEKKLAAKMLAPSAGPEETSEDTSDQGEAGKEGKGGKGVGVGTDMDKKAAATSAADHRQAGNKSTGNNSADKNEDEEEGEEKALVLEALAGAERAEAERIQAEEEVAALQAELKAAEALLEQKRAAKATREALKIVADAAEAKRSADADDKKDGDGEDTEKPSKREEHPGKKEGAGGLAGMLGSWLGGKGE